MIPLKRACLKNDFPVNANELQETADILLALARGEGPLDKRGVASATDIKDHKHDITDAKKSESHDGRSENIGNEFAAAESEEDDDGDDDETEDKKKLKESAMAQKRKATGRERHHRPSRAQDFLENDEVGGTLQSFPFHLH